MPAVYSNALSPQANQILSTQYGETGLKYGGIANWPTMAKLLWLYFVKKVDPIQALYQTNHPLQLHYGMWDRADVKTFEDSVRRSTQIAFQALKINDKKPAHILHAGCGWGGAELQLAKEHPQLKTIGVSIDAEQISLAQQFTQLYQLESQCSFSKQNFLKMPKKWDSKFDGCLALESLCHVPEDQLNLLFPSLIKTLKPKAKLVVHDWFLTKDNPSPKEQLMLEQFQKGWDMPNTPTLEVFCDEAKQAGFKIVHKKKMTPHILRSASAIYWRGAIFSPIVKLLQNSQNTMIQNLGLSHPQMLDFITTIKVQKYLFEQGIIDYYQVVFEK